jgi:hypothetical protein
MPLAKPQRRPKPAKRKEVIAITSKNRAAVSVALTKAASAAIYRGSPYHRTRQSPMGSSADRLWPDASKCDPKWTREAAVRALRRAIQDGNVSASWIGSFPRLVWILAEGVLYEARLSNSVLGEYHAYPLEDQREWPSKFRQQTLTSA